MLGSQAKMTSEAPVRQTLGESQAMDVSLRQFKTEDLQIHEKWCVEINAQQYMSRFYPRAFKGKNAENPGLYEWYVIMADGEDIGTIWLERNGQQDNTVTLGILIGRQNKLGAGIGRKAIPLAIEQASKTLHFEAVQLNVRKANTRAIACYEYCGFKAVNQGIKDSQTGEEIEFLEMRLCLSSHKQ
jgi:RimJ/RimL family protein N-acetyltransferase